MKKGQMIGQIFIFILAILVFALILFYGFKAIFSFKETGEEVGLVKLQSELQAIVKSISMDYGSVRVKEITIPAEYEEICFVDLNKRQEAVGELNRLGHPIIANALEEGGDQNVFLVPMAKTEIAIGNIMLREDPAMTRYDRSALCIPARRGKVSLAFEGLGDGTGIAPMIEE